MVFLADRFNIIFLYSVVILNGSCSICCVECNNNVRVATTCLADIYIYWNETYPKGIADPAHL